MTETYLTRKSDPELLARLIEGAKRPLTPEENFEQCVSFVFSTMSEESGVSKDWVRQGLREWFLGMGGMVV
jgi:hypothetical protein